MLVLCSNGLSSNAMHDYIAPFLTTSKTAALVVTADNIYKASNYHVPRCLQELETLGLSVDIVDLDTQPARLLLNYDVVEFIGGNPYYLLHSIRIQRCEDILIEIMRKKVLIGWSAAAFVFGPTLDLVNEYTPEMNFLHLKDLTGVGLTQHHILPHYNKFLLKFDRFEEICHNYEITHGVRVLRLNDGDGVFFDGASIHLILANQ